LVQVKHVMRRGTGEAFKAALQALGWSGQVNTACIERVNLTIRRGVAALARRTWATALQASHLESHLHWWLAYYHFVRPHGSLRVLLGHAGHTSKARLRYRQRTPAMAAGRTTHRWTTQQLLGCLLPPHHGWWGRKAGSQVLSGLGRAHFQAKKSQFWRFIGQFSQGRKPKSAQKRLGSRWTNYPTFPRAVPQLAGRGSRRDSKRWSYAWPERTCGGATAKIEGELRKLGYRVGRSTIRAVLKRQHIPGAPIRARQSSTWRSFLRQHQQQLLACDFFTVETLWLQTLYVLFFIELGTRRIHVAACTVHPTAAWMMQQARQLAWKLQEDGKRIRFLLHDRDAKFIAGFDTVFSSEHIEVILTPYRAPNANAYAERWVRSVREECLDHLLILNERH
jgi:hypothetical protein